jgi:hypothetical protein
MKHFVEIQYLLEEYDLIKFKYISTKFNEFLKLEMGKAENNSFFFIPSKSILMDAIIELHNYIFFYLIIILFLILWSIIYVLNEYSIIHTKQYKIKNEKD